MAVLLIACLFAHAAAAAVVFDRVHPHIVYGEARYNSRLVFEHGNSACAYIAARLNSGEFKIYEYTSPRYGTHPNFGVGCYYDVIALRGSGYPPGTVLPNEFFQNWVLPTPVCMNGYTRVQVGAAPNRSDECVQAGPNPPAKQCNCPRISNPVLPASGIKVASEVDYLPASAKYLRFERFYRSSPTWSSAQSIIGRFGAQWYDTYRRKLIYLSGSNPNTLTAAALLRPDGRVVLFALVQGQWLAADDIADQLSELKDALGVRSGWQYRLAEDDSTETYSADGVLTKITLRGGQTLSLFYSDPSTPVNIAPAAGLLIRVSDPFGRELKLRYDSSGRVIQLIDPAGLAYGYAYDAHNNLTTVTYPDDAKRVYHYDNAAFANALTGITDENGSRFASYEYDAQGRASASEHAGVQRYSFSYAVHGLTIITDPLNTARELVFHSVLDVLRPVSMSLPCTSGCGGLSARATTYDTNGNVASRTDFNANRTDYRYDLSRNLEIQRVEGLSAAGGPTAVTRTITTEWDTTFRLPRRIAEPLRITSFSYDSHGNLTSKSIQPTADADGAQGLSASANGSARTWTYTNTYSDAIPGLLIQQVIDGPRNDVQDITTYRWNESGNLFAITNALGHTVRFEDYDANGRPQTVTDANGLVTELRYDPRGRLISRSAGQELTTYTYDPAGQLIQVTLPDASFLRYAYDPAHRLIQIQDNAGNAIDYTLDAMGNRIQERVSADGGALVQLRLREYDALNRLSKDMGGADPAREITRYGYDSQGNLTSITDPLGHLTTHLYDALNRLARVIDPPASTGEPAGSTQYAYDGLDQLTQVTDPRGLATQYSVDGLGKRPRLQSPDTGLTLSEFDAAGNLIAQTDARGVPASFSYDALNRVRQASFGGEHPVLMRYSYDVGPNGVGRLTGLSDISGETAFAYDLHGRLTEDSRTIAGVRYVTRYDYDAAGRLIRLTYPSGRTLDYGLDALGRVAFMQTSFQGLTQAVVSNITYQPFGSVKSFVYGNAQASLRSFDLDGRVASYTLGNTTRSLAYDPDSRLVGFSQPNTALNQSFGYDDLNRLTQWSTPQTAQSFGYDAVGNRIAQTVGTTSKVYGYASNSNQLLQVTASSGPPSPYHYDPAGAIDSTSQTRFNYDGRQRLIQASAGANSTAYQVNALGQRVMKLGLNSAITTVYHYDSGGRLIAESDALGNVQVEYIYLGEIPVALIQ